MQYSVTVCLVDDCEPIFNQGKGRLLYTKSSLQFFIPKKTTTPLIHIKGMGIICHLYIFIIETYITVSPLI